MDFVQYLVPDYKNSFTEAAAKCCSDGSQKFLPKGCCCVFMEASRLQPHPSRGRLVLELVFAAGLWNCCVSLADLLAAYCQWLPEAMHQELALKWPPVAL